jgi:undecaprenyl diphosphate synthase
MKLLNRFLKTELEEMQENGIRLKTIGRTSRLPKRTREILLDTIEKTSSNHRMTLTLALSYGGRQEILDAVLKIAGQVERGEMAANEISERVISEALYTSGMPDPDLLIRTSGEYRVSNFLLWQISYSEIYITPTLWPDFDKSEYLTAIRVYQERDRRFGGIGAGARG